MTLSFHAPILSTSELTEADPSTADAQLLGALLDAAPDAAVAVDRTGIIRYANRAAEQIYGAPRSAIVGCSVSTLVRSRTDLTRLVRALCAEDGVRSEELELMRASDGHGLWVSVSASALRAADGSIDGALAYLREIGQERAARLDLERKNHELQHYVRAVSHDLRSPLVSLLGFSKLLDQDYGDRLDDKGRHFLHRIEQAGRTMEALINDLLELSRIGEAGVRRQEVNVLDLLRQLHAELKPRLDARDIALVLPDEAPILLADRMRLYQLFSNLIGNAIEHMGDPEGARVEVTIEGGSSAHHICVRDNGRGVPEDHRERIFELFHSLGPRRDGRRGTGVGLAIVRKIAETHGGRVWVESEPDRGSCFHVLLPA